MLFLVSPVSIRSFRLTVMVLANGGGSACEEELEGAEATIAGEGPEDALPLATVELPAGAAAAGSASASVGSASSVEGSGTGRVTMTVSPASLEIGRAHV